MSGRAAGAWVLVAVLGASVPARAGDACRGRLVLLGDSNVSGTLGQLLEYRAQWRGLEVVRYAKGGSGLARPDYFDWVREASQALEAYPAEVAVMVLGGNDAQGLLAPAGALPGGVRWGRAPYWEAAYRLRVKELFTVLSRGAREVFFFGPTNRGGRQARARMARIRELQREVAAEFGNLHWVDSHAFTTAHNGHALRLGLDPSGNLRRFRQGDGVHLTWAGAGAFLDAAGPVVDRAIEHACTGRASASN